MEKKPQWRRMLVSAEKHIERYVFNWVVLFIIFILLIGDIFLSLVLPLEDLKLLRFFAYVGLLALWLHATAERTAREELSEQLKAPRALFLKDQGAVYQAAAELLRKAREHPAATEIILTSLRVPRWPGGETTPEMER